MSGVFERPSQQAAELGRCFAATKASVAGPRAVPYGNMAPRMATMNAGLKGYFVVVRDARRPAREALVPRRAALEVLRDPVAHANRNCGSRIPVPLLLLQLRVKVRVVDFHLHSHDCEARDSVFHINELTNTTFDLLHAPHVLIFEEVEIERLALLHAFEHYGRRFCNLEECSANRCRNRGNDEQ